MELGFPKNEKRKPILRDVEDLVTRIELDRVLADGWIDELTRTDTMLAPKNKEK